MQPLIRHIHAEDESALSETVIGLIEGNAQVLKEIYAKYGGLFYTIARRYASSSQEAEDMVQDSFVKIFQKADTFEGNGSFEGWMKRILINTCLTAIRKKKIMYDDSYEDGQMLAHPNTGANVIEMMNAEEIISAMQMLPTGCRAVLNLHALDGFSHKEIGEELGISESASRSQLTKARHRLREILLEKDLI